LNQGLPVANVSSIVEEEVTELLLGLGLAHVQTIDGRILSITRQTPVDPS